MEELTVFELAWLVGILEGEGCFLYSAQTQSVRIRMVDQDIMEEVGRIFCKITGNLCNLVLEDRGHLKNHQDTFMIQLYGKNARLVMNTVVKHMGWRRRQAIWQALNGYGWEKKKQEGTVDLLKVLGLEKT